MMDENLALFSEECAELLERMELVLLNIESNPNDPEGVHELFRVVHTIKGASGMFGFENLVNFAHELENLAGEVRDGVTTASQDVCNVMLKSRDHLLKLVDIALQGDAGIHLEQLIAAEKILITEIQRLCQGGADPKENAIAQANSAAEKDDADTEKRLRIHLDLNPDVLTFGTDPFSCILYLESLGSFYTFRLCTEHLPDFDSFDPTTCYVSFDINFKTTEPVDDIKDAFRFIEESGRITVIEQPNEPPTNTETYQAKPGPALTAPQKRSEHLDEQARKNGTIQAETVRVDAKKLEELINLVGELVIANANTHLLTKNKEIDRLAEATGGMLSLVEDIRDTTLSLRMVQIGCTFNRFRRIVRELSIELNKKIELEISGGETELDKTVVDKISDPLMHLLRNSIDHGFEPPEIRIAAGKNAKGVIRLHAYHDSGSIVIEVSDDGKGLDKEKIVKKAIEKEIIKDTTKLSDQDVHNLIFAPGFSTAEKVTNLSGRGVGMDVVRRNISALNGQIDVETQPGLFTTFVIRLPLTLAIIDGFLVQIGGLHYVVPLDLVDECVDFDEANDAVYMDSQFINLRGEIMPYMKLKEVFELEKIASYQDEDNSQILPSDPSSANRRQESIVVIRYGAQKIGLVVNELLGEYQTVIKPLGRVFEKLNWLSGATILGNGDVALIIDVPTLVKFATTGIAPGARHAS